MKKVFLGAHGAPIINDYVNEAQDGITTALNSLAAGFGAAYFISGCVLSNVGTTWTLTAGWAFFNGELMKVPNHSWVDAAGFASNSFAYIEPVVVNNPIPYENGNSYELTRENTLKFKVHAAEPDPVYLSSFKRFGLAIGLALKGNLVEAVALPGRGFTLPAWSANDGSDNFAVKKTIEGKLIISGALNITSGHSTTIGGILYCVLLGTLDAAFRPNRTIHFKVWDSGVDYSAPDVIPGNGLQFVLFTDGKLSLRQGPVAYDTNVVFNNEVIQLS